jgi:hypothetical protein
MRVIMFRGLVREREYYVQGVKIREREYYVQGVNQERQYYVRGVNQGKRVLCSGLIREERIMFRVNQGRKYFMFRELIMGIISIREETL